MGRRLNGSLVVTCVALLVGTILLMPGVPSKAAQEALTVTLSGGASEKFYRSVLLPAFQKQTGATVNVVTGLTMQNLAKLRASQGNPQIDVVGMDAPGMLPAANEGLLQKLDASGVPNMQHLYPWALPASHDYLAYDSGYQMLAYNTKFVKSAPTSWTDLWKPEYKGKVIIPDITTSHGIFFIAIMSKVSTGNTLYNTDAAFKELTSLRPNVLTYWTGHDQVVQLLNSGQAWLAPWTADRAITQIKNGAPMDLVVPKEGALFTPSYYAIAKGTKHLRLAQSYLNMLVSPQIQYAAANTIFVGPSNMNVKLTGFAAKYLNFANRTDLIVPEFAKLTQIQPEWTSRWNQAMVK